MSCTAPVSRGRRGPLCCNNINVVLSVPSKTWYKDHFSSQCPPHTVSGYIPVSKGLFCGHFKRVCVCVYLDITSALSSGRKIEMTLIFMVYPLSRVDPVSEDISLPSGQRGKPRHQRERPHHFTFVICDDVALSVWRCSSSERVTGTRPSDGETGGRHRVLMGHSRRQKDVSWPQFLSYLLIFLQMTYILVVIRMCGGIKLVFITIWRIKLLPPISDLL